MSPVHTPGRVFTLFVIVGGVVNYSLIISLITSRFAQYHSRRERGLDTAEINGHILICSDDPNWMTEILIQIRDFEDTEKWKAAIDKIKTDSPKIDTSDMSKVKDEFGN